MSKRFELKTNFLNGHAEIIDWIESEQKDAICIFNDLGILPFSSAPSICNLLNQFNDENIKIKSLIDEKIDYLQRRYDFGQEQGFCPMHNIMHSINVLKEIKKEMGWK